MSSPPGNSPATVLSHNGRIYIDLTTYDSDGDAPRIRGHWEVPTTPSPAKSVAGPPATPARHRHRDEPYPTAGKSIPRLRFVLLKFIDLVSDEESSESSSDSKAEDDGPSLPSPSTFRR